MITGMPRIAIAVHNFDAVVTTFGDLLGLPVVDLSPGSVESLGARLAMCVPPGGSNIELMCPVDPVSPLAQSLEGFLERRGQGLFALMLEAPDPDAEAERLTAAGLQVLPLMAGAGGRDIHPRSTHGVLIRVYPTGSFQGQRAPGPQSLGLSGIMRVMVAVHDVESALAVYARALGLSADAIQQDNVRGIRRAMVRPPVGGAIELVSPLDAGRPFTQSLSARLEGRGEGLFGLVLEAADPLSVAKELSARGIATAAAYEGGIALSPDDTFGARIYVEGSGTT